MTDRGSYTVNRFSQLVYLPVLSGLGVVNLFIGSFTIFVVATRSTRHTRAYNALLLNILCWSFAADFFQAVVGQFEAQWPVPCFRAHGIVGLFNVGGKVLDSLATLIVVIYCNMIVAAAKPIYFRCVQLMFPSITKSLSWTDGVIYVLCWHIFFSIAAAYLYISCIVPADYYQAKFENFFKLPRPRSHVTCVVEKSKHKRIMTVAGLIGFSAQAIAVLIFLVVSAFYLRVERKKTKISDHTYKLQKAFTKNLTIITFVPLCFFSLPFMVFILAFNVSEDYSNYIMSTAELLMCFHDLVVSVVTLTIYSAYRIATKEYLCCVLGFLKAPQSAIQWLSSNTSTIMYIK
ncbi:hypothetical protein QR680_015715 [Steinernema hermaphroditum]|uniref:Uncharacterized protein n=1 Tax=Steinernema hermaphroditum TaxID=289476 RepID=A0AA39HBB1_9BILA|nr:hypothetical protein QR680_015715 [Steinernema hermaphroditum]